MDLHPKDAERAILGCLLQAPHLARDVRARVSEADLTGFDAEAFSILTRMLDSGQHVDPLTFRQRLEDLRALPADETGPYVIRLIEGPWAISAVGHYAEIVREASRRRQLASLGTRVQQLADDHNTDIDALALDTAGQLQQLVYGGRQADSLPPTLGEFLSVDDPGPDWIIPGLLERHDRLLVVAGEGVGKSVLIRMLAVATAAGIHPFNGAHFTPRKVLVVDCENSARQSRRRLTPLRDIAVSQGRNPDANMRIEIRPEGLDLTGGTDAAKLLRLAARLKPDLLCIGPLYRLHAGDPNDEGPARKVAAALDAARVEAGCAVITECHAGHGITGQKRDLRPYGSSLWRRWPESIRGLRPVKGRRDLVTVETAGRFDRDERDWPELLRWGGQGQWPWVPASRADIPADDLTDGWTH